MGMGSYRASDWNKLKTSRGISASSKPNVVFTGKHINEELDSRYIDMRDSYDSEDSPNSTPIIIGFDATGSMGYLAKEIATNALNEAIMQILTKKPVTDPHMMCAAFTDQGHPLQVTQFEADIRIMEQLLKVCLGGGNSFSYDTVLWYFAAKHTNIDSYNKRGKKGILIGIGDEICGGEDNCLAPVYTKLLFGDKTNTTLHFSELLSMVRERYDVVHIVVGGADRVDDNGHTAYSDWKRNMPGYVARLHETNIAYLADVIVAIIQLISGEDREKILSELDGNKAAIVDEAIRDVLRDAPGDREDTADDKTKTGFINQLFKSFRNKG